MKNGCILYTLFEVMLIFSSADNVKLIFRATCAIIYYGNKHVNSFLNKKGEIVGSKIQENM